MAGFRQAYARMRENYVRDCRKHDLHINPTIWADERIREMSLVELLDALEMWAQIIDDESAT